MAIQDPHSTACETTIFAGSLAILVADDSYELQSYVWWWHPHFSWFGFLESTSIPTFVPWISLKSRIRLRPWLPHLADLHQTLSQRAIAQEALDIFQITQGVPRWGDSYESLGMMWCFFQGNHKHQGMILGDKMLKFTIRKMWKLCVWVSQNKFFWSKIFVHTHNVEI